MTLQLDIDKIIHLYTVEKMSVMKISGYVEASPTTILVRLRKWGVPIRAVHEIKGRHDIDADIDKIISLYVDAEQSLMKIANLYKTTAPTVRNRLKRAGIRMRHPRELKNEKTKYVESLDPKAIAAVYNSGKPLFETSWHFNISVPTLRKILNANGIRIRSATEQRWLRQAEKTKPKTVDIQIPTGTFEEQVKHLREHDNLRIDEIAEVLGADRVSVFQCMGT